MLLAMVMLCKYGYVMFTVLVMVNGHVLVNGHGMDNGHVNLLETINYFERSVWMWNLIWLLGSNHASIIVMYIVGVVVN